MSKKFSNKSKSRSLNNEKQKKIQKLSKRAHVSHAAYHRSIMSIKIKLHKIKGRLNRILKKNKNEFGCIKRLKNEPESAVKKSL